MVGKVFEIIQSKDSRGATEVTAALVLAASIFVPTQVQAATTVTSSTTTWTANYGDSDPFDYVVNSDTTINGRVMVDPWAVVNLTIADGATLTVTGGITLAQGSSLYVKGTGKLIAGVSGNIASGYPGIGLASGGLVDDGNGVMITLGNCNATVTGDSGASGIGTADASRKPALSVEHFDGTLTATGGASGASSDYVFSTPVTGNIILVAQWTQNAGGTGTNTGTELPNTDSLDARGVYATVLILSALCAGGAFLVRRRSQRKS